MKGQVKITISNKQNIIQHCRIVFTQLHRNRHSSSDSADISGSCSPAVTQEGVSEEAQAMAKFAGLGGATVIFSEVDAVNFVGLAVRSCSTFM